MYESAQELRSLGSRGKGYAEGELKFVNCGGDGFGRLKSSCMEVPSGREVMPTQEDRGGISECSYEFML
jgi:hypothetical protein